MCFLTSLLESGIRVLLLCIARINWYINCLTSDIGKIQKVAGSPFVRDILV